MALFTGFNKVEGTRSNTALVRSGHMSPADKWILDPIFQTAPMASAFPGGKLFDYEYGGAGAQDVVIPKGRMVGVGAGVKDYVSKKVLTTITLPGLATNANTIGMVPYNICKDMTQVDRFGGNQASVITLEYVNLPYMPAVTPNTNYNQAGVIAEEVMISGTDKMPWGAVIGQVQEGDFVKSTPSGRLTKWIKGTDDFSEVVGQVYAMDLNAEPTGWLKWMLWDESARNEDDAFMNRSGASNLPGDGGYPYDPAYSEGNTIFQQYQSRLVNEPSGIPGLHDGSGNYAGFGKNDTEYTGVALGTAVVGMNAFQTKDFAGQPLGNITDIEVSLGGSVLTEATNPASIGTGEYTISRSTGSIIVNAGAEGAVTATYKAKHPGTKTGMDFKGVHGEVHVLLMK